MIIFDLDGTLADCEHRRHLVDPSKNPDYFNEVHSVELITDFECGEAAPEPRYVKKKTGEKFKPDWKSFYEACGDDKPILETFQAMYSLKLSGFELVIWSDRCESTLEQTKKWLFDVSVAYDMHRSYIQNLPIKLRTFGDDSPQEELFEKFIEDRLSDLGKQIDPEIEMVFSSHKPTIEMFRKIGIFVFDCNQGQ